MSLKTIQVQHQPVGEPEWTEILSEEEHDILAYAFSAARILAEARAKSLGRPSQVLPALIALQEKLGVD